MCTSNVFSIKHMLPMKRQLIFIHCAGLVIDLARCLLRAADSNAKHFIVNVNVEKCG